MTEVRRPIHLQLGRPAAGPGGDGGFTLASPSCHKQQQQQNKTITRQQHQPATKNDNDDSLPSQILPHLFVGNQEQTNDETVNTLNISYILSLGLLPLVSMNGASPTTITTNSVNGANQNHQLEDSDNHTHLLPSRNSSKDFKIRVRSSTAVPASPVTAPIACSQQAAAVACCPIENRHHHNHHHHHHHHNHLNIDRTLPMETRTATITSAGQAATVVSEATIRSGATLDRGENGGIKAVRSIRCKCINIADNAEQILSKFFDEAHQFIDEARRRKCNILVHCLAGISRSPTIAIAYLMRVKSLRLQDAYNLVKRCRPQIDPNLSFMGQLMVHEKSLAATKQNASRTLTSHPSSSSPCPSNPSSDSNSNRQKQQHQKQTCNRVQTRARSPWQ